MPFITFDSMTFELVALDDKEGDADSDAKPGRIRIANPEGPKEIEVSVRPCGKSEEFKELRALDIAMFERVAEKYSPRVKAMKLLAEINVISIKAGLFRDGTLKSTSDERLAHEKSAKGKLVGLLDALEAFGEKELADAMRPAYEEAKAKGQL